MPNKTTFRRYCRGGWAIMSSLHTQVRIGVLSVAMLATSQVEALTTAHIEQGERHDITLDTDSLDEVTVTGTMAPLTALQAPRIVSVITREEINQSAAQTVNDLLKSVTGVDVRQRGGFGIQTDISIDGGTFDQITILLNGVDITNPQTGHHSAEFPVTPSDIERIEVLEGAASRTYGNAAFGGAINIVTKSPTPALPERGGSNKAVFPPFGGIEGGLQAGSFGTIGGDVRGAFGGHSVSASFVRSDGGTVNSEFNKGTAYVSGKVSRPRDFEFSYQAGMASMQYGANTFYSAAYPDQWEEETRWLASATLRREGPVGLSATAHWQRNVDHFQLTRHSDKGENFHRSDVMGSTILADTRWRGGTTAVSADIRQEGILSTNLGRPLDEQRVGRYDHRDNRTQVSLSAEHNLLTAHWTVSGGVRAVMNSAVDHRYRLYPGIDAAWRPNRTWKVYASYNKGFRMPTFTDLYYKSPTQEGNVGLRPEVSHSTQFGVSMHNAQCTMHNNQPITVSATTRVFWHRGRQMIDWVMLHEGDIYHSTPFDLDNLGAQATVNVRLPHNIALGAGYTWMHQWRHDEQEVYKSCYALEYLRHKFTARLSHPIWRQLSATWDLRLCNRAGSYIDHGTGLLTPYSTYAILDAKVQWQAPHYTVWVSGQNITATRYYDVAGIPQPRAWLMAGVRWKL